nr:unnamed protein product [Callosobruchus analis]
MNHQKLSLWQGVTANNSPVIRIEPTLAFQTKRNIILGLRPSGARYEGCDLAHSHQASGWNQSQSDSFEGIQLLKLSFQTTLVVSISAAYNYRTIFRMAAGTDFTNVRGLASNINAVHQHLQAEKPHILALMETQVGSSTLDNLFKYPGYEIYTRFRRRFGVCVYVKAGLSCHREEELEPEGFDIIWLKISFRNHSKFICCVYRPPKIVFLGDFNVHNSYWLKHSNKTDDEGREAEAFAISCGLKQIVKEPTRIPSRHGDFASLLDLYLTTTPTIHTVNVSAPLGLSEHNTISTLCNLQYSQEITEVIMSGMEAYIPHIVKRPSKNKPWFNQSCREAVAYKNQKYREWQRNPNTESHRCFTDARNRCKHVIESSKEEHNQKIKNKLLSCPSSSRTFWSVAKAITIVLKRCAVELTPILCKLFKVSYEQGVFPATWKIGCVQPIPKKGKKPIPTITDL